MFVRYFDSTIKLVMSRAPKKLLARMSTSLLLAFFHEQTDTQHPQ